MDIANPIYDTVFKYLMNDNRVAKMMISAITGLEIDTLEFHTTEKSSTVRDQTLAIYRLDFAAIVVTAEGEKKKVLIEIQKAKFPHDIIRFRKYLAGEYQNQNNLEKAESKGNYKITAIPIITIYFLGYKLELLRNPVINVNRIYQDAITKKEIKKREEFIEGLTHDSHIIQIPYLKQKHKNDLLRILSVFDQEQMTPDKHILRIQEEDYPKKYWPIIRRLQKAIAESEVRKKMDFEDEVIEDLEEKDRIILRERAEKEKALQAEAEQRAEKEKALQAEAEQRAEKEKSQQAEAKLRAEKKEKDLEIEMLRRELKEIRGGKASS